MNDNTKKQTETDAAAENYEGEAGSSTDQPSEEVSQSGQAEVADPPEEISLAEFEELKAKAAKAEQNWNQFLRATADFENFRKRAARERQEAIKFANEALLEKLLPVLDNFEMALQAANDPKTGNIDALRTGVSMIQSQFRGVLTDSGIEEIDATGKPFDPNWHEAVSQQEAADTPEGHVIQQIRKGYKLRDRLIRPASVIVAKKPAS